jgi:hypothetical protein
MPRLIAPNGATVNVSDERAERLLATGYKPADKAAKAPAKKAASKPVVFKAPAE